jgi:hypothetical protein
MWGTVVNILFLGGQRGSSSAVGSTSVGALSRVLCKSCCPGAVPDFGDGRCVVYEPFPEHRCIQFTTADELVLSAIMLAENAERGGVPRAGRSGSAAPRRSNWSASAMNRSVRGDSPVATAANPRRQRGRRST